MPSLDPIFAFRTNPARYLDSDEFLNVRLADLEDEAEQQTADAARKRIEIPILEREVAEHERDAAIAKLKLLELRAEAAKRQAGRR